MRARRYLKFFLMAMVVLMALAIPSKSFGQVSVGLSVHIGPPVLPVYVQPPVPAPGYIWTPGYWAYGDDGYYWVPGTWVLAPTPGYLWTPGYWGWGGGLYIWHGGYWGPHVGFYGGVNYGFGYGGVGFEGGRWDHGVFAYNRSVTNVTNVTNTTIVNNTYNKTVVVNNTTNNHVSFNGGTGGTTAQPTAAETAAANEHHVRATAEQTQHVQQASHNHALLASVNGGKPAIAATPKAGAFTAKGVVAAKAAGPTNRPAANAAKTYRPPSAQSSANKGSGNANGAANTAHTSATSGNRPASAVNSNSANRPATAQNNVSRPQNANNPPRNNASRPQNANNQPRNNASHPQPQQHRESAPKSEGKPGH
jgi:hypothetical protein